MDPSVTFSFDCEGKWGMADISSNWDSILTQKNLSEAYGFILKTLENNDLKATFGFVGALTDKRDYFLEEILPKLPSENYDSWLSFSKKRLIDQKEEGWFEPDLLSMVREYEVHEIASHGYTHIPFNLLDERIVHIELKLIKSWYQRNNLSCSTMIYPRNIIKYSDLLSKYGIYGFRNIPNDFSQYRLPKTVKTLLEEFNLFKKSEEFLAEHPVKIPGGTFINWQHGMRKYVPSSISLLKYKSILEDAIVNRGAAHFWIHPHNFITSPATKDLFVKLCEEVTRLRRSTDLLNKNQNDFLC